MARTPAELDESDIVRLLDPTGVRHASADYDAYAAELGPAELLALYRDMVVVRRIDAEGTALQRQGEVGLWPPVKGQEAAQLGSARALAPADFVFATYRDHGVAYGRGIRGAGLTRVWRGSVGAGWDPYEARMAGLQVIIGAQTLHATGWALGETIAKGDQAPDAAIAYFGDGATSEGDVSEAMVFAASFRLPVVFFCQNNQWAISEPVTLQAPGEIADRGRGFGIPSVRVDATTIIDLLEGIPDGVNVDHLCLVIEPTDLEALRDTFRFEVVDGPGPRFGAQGEGMSLYVRDPDGNVVELRHY